MHITAAGVSASSQNYSIFFFTIPAFLLKERMSQLSYQELRVGTRTFASVYLLSTWLIAASQVNNFKA